MSEVCWSGEKNPLYQLWEVDFYPGVYSDIAYSIKSLDCISYCYLDLSDLTLKDSPVPLVLRKTKKRNPAYFETNTIYVFLGIWSAYPAAINGDDFSKNVWTHPYHGLSKLGWIFNENGVSYNIQSNLPVDSSLGTPYLGRTGTTPKVIYTKTAPSTDLLWDITDQSDYYNLFFRVKHVSSQTYLTGPSSLTDYATMSLSATIQGTQLWRLTTLLDNDYF